MPGSYEICPVCFWEDDRVQFRWPAMSGGANKVPAGERVAVLLFGADVVGEVGQGAGGVAGHGAGGGAADAGVAGLGAVVAEEGVFGSE